MTEPFFDTRRGYTMTADVRTTQRAYPAYKDSGVEWLGEIPAHWQVTRLRYLLNTNPSKNKIRLADDELVSFVPMEAVGEYGGLNLEIEKPLSEIGSGYTYFADKDVVVAKITPCFENGKGALAFGLTNGIAFGTTELHVLRSSGDLDQKFLFYLTISHFFRKLGEAEMYGAGGQKRIPDSFVKEMRLGIPPLPEQDAIARFLDHKTAQIDALIAKKEALLARLADKRTALISQAVTKGLDPTVPLRDSGIEWLGEIPAHWEVVSLRYACEFLNRRRIPLSAEERGKMSEHTYPYYGASGVIDYVEDYIFDEPTVLIAEDGANLLSRSTPLAFIADGKYWVNNHAHILKPLKGPFEYWAHLLCTVEYAPWITGAAQPKLTKENLGGIKLPLPSSQEQTEICAYIASELTPIDSTIKHVQQVIVRLKDYRAALITNAVTGKIDVRDFA
ncbi:restriction endonuclease subunit S [bacterium]|nr:restriction endonuclease subunit S [bacterium]